MWSSQIPLTLYMHSCAPCTVYQSTCQQSFLACWCLHVKHLQFTQTLFRGLTGMCGLRIHTLCQHKQARAHCKVACCFPLSSRKKLDSKAKRRCTAPTGCKLTPINSILISILQSLHYAKLQLMRLILKASLLHYLLCTALHDQLQVLACCKFGILLYM